MTDKEKEQICRWWVNHELRSNRVTFSDKVYVSTADIQDFEQFICSLQEEPVSDDLEEEIQRYKDSHDYMSEYIRKVARYFALWGKIHLKDPVCKVLEEAATRAAYHQYQDREKDYISENEKKKFIEGAQWKEQLMMQNAIEREVKQDAGGYHYIDATELYDYDKDEPLAKSGDKVKVLIVKQE